MLFINRDWNRTESDDFKLNVEKFIGKDNRSVAVPQYSAKGELMGWKIQEITD